MRGAKRLAFDAFDRGQRPSQLKMRRVKRRTLYRYFQEWKRGREILSSSRGIDNTPPEDTSATELKSEPATTGSLAAQFEAFKVRQELESHKGKLSQRVQELFEAMKQATEEYEQSGVTDERWDEGMERLEGQMADFVLAHLGRVESEGALKFLAETLDSIEFSMNSLFTEYAEKAAERERLRQQREAEQERLRREREIAESKRLLLEVIKPELCPPDVRKAIESKLLVRRRSEAQTILQAVTHYEVINELSRAEPANRKQKWLAFIRELDSGRWGFIKKLNAERDDWMRLTFGEWLWCPRCWTRYTVRPVPAVYTCIRCGSPINRMAPGPAAYL